MTEPSHRRPSPFGRLLERIHVEGGLGGLGFAAGVTIRELKPSGAEADVAAVERKRIGRGAVEEPESPAEITDPRLPGDGRVERLAPGDARR